MRGGVREFKTGQCECVSPHSNGMGRALFRKTSGSESHERIGKSLSFPGSLMKIKMKGETRDGRGKIQKATGEKQENPRNLRIQGERRVFFLLLPVSVAFLVCSGLDPGGIFSFLPALRCFFGTESFSVSAGEGEGKEEGASDAAVVARGIPPPSEASSVSGKGICGSADSAGDSAGKGESSRGRRGWRRGRR